jgi:phosphate transport system substrate-binding protein
MKKKTLIAIAAAVLVVAALFVFTAPGPAEEQQKTIKVSGAWALYPLMVTWAEEYQKIHPDVRVEVSAGGAGKGMTDALGGLVELGMVSRGIYPEETSQGAVYIAVTKDAVVATVNRDNPVLEELLEKGLSRETFEKIYITGEITTWGEAAGTGSTDKLNVYTRSDACGAADTWAAYFGKKQEDLKGVGVYGDPGVVEAVKEDPLGIGFNNIGYAYDAGTMEQFGGIVVVPIDINGNGQLDPEEDFYANKAGVVEAIGKGIFPHPPARELNLVTKDEFTGPTREFVEWILTDGQAYVEEAGYVPLTQERIEEQLEKLG